MTTKQAVNLALEQIGADGMNGVYGHGSSAITALGSLRLPGMDNAVLARIIAEIRRQDLATITHHNESYHFQLTVKGIHRLQRALVERVQISKQWDWDGMWRMVTYDVPRAQSAQRRLFTRQLERLGFMMIRESVWMHPYPCFYQLEEIIKHCGLQRHVTFAEISRLDTVSSSRLMRAYPELSKYKVPA